jgi:hypothetical protein
MIAKRKKLRKIIFQMIKFNVSLNQSGSYSRIIDSKIRI